MIVGIFCHERYPNEVADKVHFDIGTVHEVMDQDADGVYLPDANGDPYFFSWNEVTELQELDDSVTLGGTGC